MISSEEKYSSSNKNMVNGESKVIKSEFSEGLILDESNSKKQSNLFSIIMSILFGQLISLLCVGNGYFSQYIQNERKIVTPLLLNSCYYILIFILYGIIILKLKIKKPKLIYLILSILDTQANYINIFIFSFAKFEYPYIINVLSSMWSVLFTLILIKKYKYLKNHIFGIAICLVGVFLLFLGTFQSFGDFIKMFKDFNDNLKGLLLSILVSILYGINAVLMEKYFLNDEEIKCYCSWLGIIGFSVSIIQSFIPISDDGFEFKILFNSEFDFPIFICWILSAISLATMTSISPFYIQKYSANMFNISLLFTIFWSFLIDALFIVDNFNFYGFCAFFIAGFIVVIIGTVIFSSKERVDVEKIEEDNNNNKEKIDNE
jgi:hypothetical protein